jgi:dihydroceramidase
MNALRLVALICLFVALPLLILLVVRGPVDDYTPTTGHWPLTANTDWCEPNYQVSPYVAEFGNTLSSIIIIFNGLYGMYQHYNQVEIQYIYAYACFLVVGIGSCLFHGTLMREFQLADELPMLWSNGVFIFCILTTKDTVQEAARRFGYMWSIGGVTLIMTLLVVFFDQEDQTIFLVAYSSGVYYIMYSSYCLDCTYNSTGEVMMLETSLCFYVGGFVLWLVDRLYCNGTVPVVGMQVRSMYLHSFWHVGAGLGTFTSVLFFIWTRGKHLKR